MRGSWVRVTEILSSLLAPDAISWPIDGDLEVATPWAVQGPYIALGKTQGVVYSICSIRF